MFLVIFFEKRLHFDIFSHSLVRFYSFMYGRGVRLLINVIKTPFAIRCAKLIPLFLVCVVIKCDLCLHIRKSVL